MSVTKVMIGAFCALLAGILVEGAKATQTASDRTSHATAGMAQPPLPQGR
jgi:hypothetical protein